MKKVIDLKCASVSVKKNIILKDISLAISAGEFVAIIGPNGSGKTTLLTAINGLGRVGAGIVEIEGKPMSFVNENKIRQDIGYVPQWLNVDARSPVSAKEVVKMGRFGRIGLFGKWTRKDEEIVHEAMATVGVGYLANQPIGQLSGGERQKVLIASALAQSPKILLLDEPTSNLDPSSQKEVIRLIEKIYYEKGFTVVFVTHLLNRIPECCNQVILMKERKIFFKGVPTEALQEKKLSELYDCPVFISEINGRHHYHIGNEHA